MPVYLPIAEMSVSAGAVVLLGIVVGFFSGLFGIGGGALTTPLLIFFGIPPVVAVATQTCQIIASSTAGFISQLQRRGIDFKIAGHMMTGGAIGAVIGLGIFQLLRMLGQIDLAIKALYMVLLGGIGVSMIVEITRSYLRRDAGGAPTENRVHRWLKTLPMQTEYPVSGITISRYGPMGIGFVSGILLAILGTGAGFMVVPAMIYFLGMPALMVTGTSMLQLLVLTSLAAMMHALTTHAIDLILGALLIFGSVIGTILGLRSTKYVHGRPARLLLAAIIVVVAIRMGFELVIPPHDPYTLSIGH